MDNSLAIDVSGVWKKFRLYHERNYSIKEAILRRKRVNFEEFWALKDVSFKVKKGETLGIIGENGSGKSTLLKLIARILRPNKGEIKTNGKVSALLELGAGFHPELTGRENTYLNGAILGLTKKEIDAKFEEIVSFAELERFIDTPVKNYSSGMYIRLGFAIAINVNPDILLIDEVLAVGDESFQQKCLARINDFKERGKTILFITHDLGTAERVCNSLIMLEEGEIKDQGRPRKIIREYHDSVLGETEGKERGSKEISIIGAKLLGADGEEKETFSAGEPMKIRIEFEAKRPVKSPVFGLAVYDQRGFEYFGTNTQLKNFSTGVVNGKGVLEFNLEHLPMSQGRFFLTLAIHSPDEKSVYHWQERMYSFNVESESEDKGFFYIPCDIKLSLDKIAHSSTYQKA